MCNAVRRWGACQATLSGVASQHWWRAVTTVREECFGFWGGPLLAAPWEYVGSVGVNAERRGYGHSLTARKAYWKETYCESFVVTGI